INVQYALTSRLRCDVSAGADKHVDVSLHGQDVNFDVVKVLGEKREQPQRHKDHGQEFGFRISDFGFALTFSPNPKSEIRIPNSSSCLCLRGFHFFVRSFCWYSGYIVSGPPSAASTGIPWRFTNSLMKGFSPGR